MRIKRNFSSPSNNQGFHIFSLLGSLRSRRKRGSGRTKNAGENGVLGARDEGTRATKTLIFSSPPTDFQTNQKQACAFLHE